MNCPTCNGALVMSTDLLGYPNITTKGETMMRCETCRTITTERSRTTLATRIQAEREAEKIERRKHQQEAANRAARRRK